MNFQTILEELDRLYEEDVTKVTEEETAEEETALTESADEEEIEIEDDSEDEAVEEIPEDAEEEPEETEEVRLVLECANCGAVVIRTDSEVTVDEATGVANSGEACQYCEEAEGYKILGKLDPYAAEEEQGSEETEDKVEAEDEVVVEESLLDVDLPVSVDIAV